MKKNKNFEIKRLVYEDAWCPDIGGEWDTFKRLAEERIAHSISKGYSNPIVRTRGDWDSQEFEIVLTKLEDEAAYNKRKLIAEAKQEKERTTKIEKLKKEAKELGLKVGE
jgi:hypothetical protein